MAYKDYVLRDGPVAYWPVDDLTTPYPDEVGSNDLQVLSGNVSSSADPVFGGGAWFIDGSANIESTSDFPTGPNSLECWIRFPDKNTEKFIGLGDSDPSSSGIEIRSDSETGNEFAGNINPSGDNFTTGVDLSVDVWHHLVLVLEGLDTIHFYADGEFIGSATSSDLSDRGRLFRVNLTRWGETYDGNHDIDELAVYNYVLTPDQIARHYWAGKGKTGYALEVLSSRPTFYTPLDESSNPPIDVAGGASVSSTVGTPVLGASGATSQTNTAVTLDGSSWYVWNVTASDLGIDGAKPRTLEAWVQVTGSGKSAVAAIGNGNSDRQDFGLIYFPVDVGTDGWRVQLWGDDLEFFVSNTENNWHYIAVVYDGSELIVFADAEEVARKTVTLNTYSAQSLYIGNWSFDTGTYGFSGDIDELAITPRALTPTEIRRHYYAGLGEDGYSREVLASGAYTFYNLDEAAGSSTASDSSPNSIDASYNGDITLEQSTGLALGTSVLFGGAGAYIEPSSASLPDAPAEFTLSAWINAADTSGLEYIFTFHESGGGANNAIDLATDGATLRLRLNESEGTGETPPSITSGTWHHIAATVVNDGSTDNVVYYLDGEAKATRTYSTTVSGLSTIQHLFGARTTTGDQQYAGNLDNIATFDRALTEQEIRRHYWFGKLGEITNLLRVIEGTVEDADGNPLDATVLIYRWADGTLLKTVITDSSTGTYRAEEFEATEDMLVTVQPPSGFRPMSHGPLPPVEEQV